MRALSIVALTLAAVIGLLATSSHAALVAYYPLDGNANDASGNGLHGTPENGTSFGANVPAAIGGGMSAGFDGADDFIDLGNPGALNFGTNDWTVSGWINATEPANNNRGTLFSNGGDGGGGIRYTLTQNEANNGSIRLITDDNSDKHQRTSSTITNNDGWHHIVGVRRGNTTEIWVNGVLEDSGGVAAGYDLSGTSQQNAHIGAARQQSGGGLIKQLDGRVDDVGIWNSALPGSSIAGLADGTFTPLTAPLVGPPTPTSSQGGFTFNQFDASSGNGSVAIFHQGILFSGPLGTPTVTQLDPAPGGPVPATAVGHITTGVEPQPGGNGPHVGYSGSVIVQGHIRDDLDPNTATSDPGVTNIYEITVPLTMVTGAPHNYVFNTFDDNGAGNDVDNNLTHRGWVGDPGDAHRHTGQSNDYDPGADEFTASASFNLGGNASSDDLGFSAGVGSAAPSPGALFVDDIHVRGILASAVQNAVFVGSRQTALGPVINSVMLSGSGLAPEGAVVENGLFGEDALMFTDRTHEWNSNSGDPTIAELGLDGADYIRFANDDRSPGDLMAVIGLEPGPKDLYLLIDSRINDNNVANILNGHPFADSGILIGADESGDGDIDQTSRLFVLAGFEDVFIELGPQGQGGTNNYGFIAVSQPLAPVPEPATATLSLLGLAGLAMRRRRRA